MSTAGFVLACALNLLGRSEAALPPIVILDHAPAESSANAAAFVRRGDPVIYVIASSAPIRHAMEAQTDSFRCHGDDVLRLIASIIVHEEWHLKHDSSEAGAYYAQLTALQQLGLGPGRWPYDTVRKSLNAVRRAEAQRMRAARDQLAAR